jgi:hypothetical protein
MSPDLLPDESPVDTNNEPDGETESSERTVTDPLDPPRLEPPDNNNEPPKPVDDDDDDPPTKDTDPPDDDEDPDKDNAPPMPSP